MERSQYQVITKIIGQTIRFLNKNDRLAKDDIDEIKNQTLLKLTPQLKKILLFEPLHLENFVRKTTRSVFWDYLKSISTDLSAYRLKKRIKRILHHLEEAKCQFLRPDNDTPWFKETTVITAEITPTMTPQEKRNCLENISREWIAILPSPPDTPRSFTADDYLTGLITTLLNNTPCGISVNDIFSVVRSAADIEEIFRVPLEITGPDQDDDSTISIMDMIPAEEIGTGGFKADEAMYYENYAEEFLKNHTTKEQTMVYFFRFVLNLDYKEIEKQYHINIKTAESRLSIKPDKKGFLWRLVQFIKHLDFTLSEAKIFLDILDRKIADLYSNIKIEA